MPRAHAETGTGHSLEGKTVQSVTSEMIGRDLSSAGNLANTGRRDNS